MWQINRYCLLASLALKLMNFFPIHFLTIKSEEFHRKKDQLCTGATQMSLTNEGLKKIKITVPNKSILENFGMLTLPLLDKIFVLQKINKLLRTLEIFSFRNLSRASLMYRI